MSSKKRKIVYTGIFDPFLGDGVSSSVFDLLRFLGKRDHEVGVVSFMPNKDWCRWFIRIGINRLEAEIIAKGETYCHYNMDGINIYFELLPLVYHQLIACHPLALEHYLGKIREYPDSYFLTADENSTCLLAHSILGTPSAHLIHSPVKSIDIFDKSTVLQKILKKRTVFAVNVASQEALLQTLGVQALIWPPFIDPVRFRFPASNRQEMAIGYYSAGPHKGDSIITALIKEMPDRKFVIMGSKLDGIASPRVTQLGPITDLKLFYGEIALLLVPSMIVEGYPRVIMEAAINGIPSIANRIGGIPEAVGNAGVLIDMEAPENMVEKYKLAVNGLLDDPEKYEAYRQKALNRAEEYQAEIEQLSIRYDHEFF